VNTERLALGSAALAVIVMSLACGGGGGGGGGPAAYSAPAPVPQARIVIGDTSVTDACAGIFSSCSRASCIVINAGDGTGSVNVEMIVASASGQELSHGEALVLDPGDRKTVSYDFNGFDAATVRCQTR
jgi:hypothetical protein